MVLVQRRMADVLSSSRILAVTDLSPAGDVALAEAVRRARDVGATLAVVHAIPSIESIRPLFPQGLAEEAVLTSELPLRAEALVRERLQAAGASGSIEVFVEAGTTVDVSLRVIERWRPGLVVIGAPDDGAIDAARLVRHGTAPVLIARPSPATKRIVAGTDFSDPALPAIRAAAAAVGRSGGELVVVHAIEAHPISIYGVDLPALVTLPGHRDHHVAVQVRLDEALATLGVVGKGVVYDAAPAHGLVDAARSLEAELLVVATHGRTGLTRFLLGSVAETVLRRAPCSVLVVRAG